MKGNRNSLVLLICLIFSSSSILAQAGNFNIDNQTDCNATISLAYDNSGSCGSSPCTGGVIGGLTAYAHSNTAVHNGSGIQVWTDVIVTAVSSSCNEYDGVCGGSGGSAACDCGGQDLSITWVDCNNAIITIP